MIIPSINIADGKAVSMIGGEKIGLEAGSPIGVAERYGVVGEIAVIDLDAARGTGGNEEVITDLVAEHSCMVGGGIRDEETALKWLDKGASKIIIGTAAKPALLSKLPRDRVIVSLDTRHGEVVVDGMRTGTGKTVIDLINELKENSSGFLITFVESEGMMAGIDMARVEQIIQAAGKEVSITVAGGIATLEEIAAVDKLGADAQVGMALLSGKLDLADAFLAPIHTDRPDGLWSTVIVDELGTALGLAYSDLESVRDAINHRRGTYHSRSRGLWVKGLTSGNTQKLVNASLDCDRDAIRFVVTQGGKGFCHNDTWTCWGEEWGMAALLRKLNGRVQSAPTGSYTKRLLDDPELLKAKLIEEAEELARADDPGEVALEAADVFYFALVAMARSGVDLPTVEKALEKRSLKITRRPGDAKNNT
jgi:phosphoribosyl-ATP pyrophosphohydrolase/phosphoribosyl-AMP cyclohydrolase